MPSRVSALPEPRQAPTITEALKQKAMLLLLLSVFVSVVTYAVLSLIAPRYESETVIAIEPEGATSSTAMDQAAISTYIGALESSFLLRPIADELALAKQPEFNGALGPVDLLHAARRAVGLDNDGGGANELTRVVTALRDSLDIHGTNDRHAIVIRATSLDPVRAAKIANAIADKYAAMLAQEAKSVQMGFYRAPDAPKSKAAAPPVAHILSKAVPNAVPAYPKKIELSVVAGAAFALFAVAWIVVTTALRGLPKRQPEKPSASHADAPAPKPEPLLETKPEIADEPILAENISEPVELPAEPDDIAAVSSAMTHDQSTAFTEIEKLALRLKAQRPSGGGHRTLITSESEDVIPYEQALELAKVLAGCGAQTILIDWSPGGKGFAKAAGVEASVGWNDLLQGRATFDDIIHRLPGSRAQVIASGVALPYGGRKLDADLLNLALDALDEVYDHIVVTGRHNEARALFECIEGRFDAGITVEPNGDGTSSPSDATTFLSFDVTDIDILHYRRPEPPVSAMAQRIARATRARELAVQHA